MSSEAAASNLARLQRAFRRQLQDGDGDIADSIVDDPLVGSSRRLGIYQYAYFARLEEALAEDFPALHAVLGDQAFTELCREYSRCHPSSHPSLRWFGAQMAGFLSRSEPYRSYPLLSELARFEWLLIMAFDTEDAPVLGEADAARVPPQQWPGLRIALHPAVHSFSYRWNILPIWQACKAEAEVPEPVQLPGRLHGVIWREDSTTRYRSLEAEEYLMMQRAREGADFSALCEALSGIVEPDQAPLSAAGILRTWLKHGMVTALRT